MIHLTVHIMSGLQEVREQLIDDCRNNPKADHQSAQASERGLEADCFLKDSKGGRIRSGTPDQENERGSGGKASDEHRSCNGYRPS